MKASPQGQFWVMEGADGAGTTTQAERFAEWLRCGGLEVHVTAQPSGGVLGRAIRDFLQKGAPSSMGYQRLALMFAADRLAHYEDEVAPHLNAGTHVISDRYLLSSLVYQGLHLPLAWVKDINQFAPPPDVTFVLDVDADVAWQRQMQRGAIREMYDERELHSRICDRYRALSPLVQGEMINGNLSMAQVLEQLTAVAASRLGG